MAQLERKESSGMSSQTYHQRLSMHYLVHILHRDPTTCNTLVNT
jgi:hypothetical protein